MAPMTLKRFAPLLALAGMILAPFAVIAHGISDADKQRMLAGSVSRQGCSNCRWATTSRAS